MTESTVEQVLGLRARVLRPGLPVGAARLPGDLDPGTVVLAAWLDGRTAGAAGGAHPAGTATLMDQPCPWRAGVTAVRLRAMATDPPARGLGVGAELLRAAARRAVARGAELIWCHARGSAAGFYRRAGWSTHGEPFDVPGIGPHLQMETRLAPPVTPGPIRPV